MGTFTIVEAFITGKVWFAVRIGSTIVIVSTNLGWLVGDAFGFMYGFVIPMVTLTIMKAEIAPFKRNAIQI
jgi:hypothetical protein